MIELQVDERFTAQVDEAQLIAVAEQTLAAAGKNSGELTIVITDNETVQQLNAEYRGIDAPTDVLSFASQETVPDSPQLALPAEVAATLDAYLGDILIAYPYAEQQAAQYGNSVAAELRLLTVHGVLHLLGYDHGTPAEEAAMWAQQEQILALFGDTGLSQRNYLNEADHD